MGTRETSSNPLVSVVLPTYKRPELLRRAVASVFDQTYPNWELVVSDDEVEKGEVWDYLEKLAAQDDRVRIFKNTRSHGQVGNTNNALSQARGEWIKLLHDDDALKPACLAELVRVSTIRDTVACITCEAERFVDGQLAEPSLRAGWPLVEIIPKGDVLPTMYVAENTGGALPSQKMIHRSVVEAGVRMEQHPGLRWMVDSWFNAQIAQCGDLLIYRKPLVEWHQGTHTTETSATTEDDRDRELGLFRTLVWQMLKDPSRHPPLDVMKKMVLLQQAVWQFKRQHVEDGWRLLRRVDDWRAYVQFFLWGLHHISRGRYARGEREIVARNSKELAHLLEEKQPSGVHRSRQSRGNVSMTIEASNDTTEMTNGVQASPATTRLAKEGRTARIERMVILHSRLSGYMAACLRAFKERTGAELLVVRYPPTSNAPFDNRHFAWIDHLHDGRALSKDEIQARVDSFGPDVALVSGWFDSGYLSVSRRLRKRGIPVIAGCDAQWTGSVRQQLGRIVAPWHLHSAIDVLWVAGERQRELAHRFGYTGKHCWEGYYACDWKQFAAAHDAERPRPKSFLFVGRYVPVKGLDTLLAAYRQYRSSVAEPWPLICAGAGEMASSLRKVPGVVDKGFMQPDQLPALMKEAGVFVLPSRREPWGVVVQEAATAGLPVLCSTASGAAVHLVQDRYNGFLFEPEDASHLAQLMERVTTLPPESRRAMSRASHALSKQFTPQRWVDTLVEGVAQL